MTSSSPTSGDDRRRRGDLRSFARFVLVGLVNTAASYALFVALELVLPYVAKRLPMQRSAFAYCIVCSAIAK